VHFQASFFALEFPHCLFSSRSRYRTPRRDVAMLLAAQQVAGAAQLQISAAI